MNLKKLTALFMTFIITASVLLFTACTGNNGVMGLTVDDECYVNVSPDISYTQSTYDSTIENIQSLSNIVEKQTASDLSCSLLAGITSIQLTQLIDACSLARIYYDTDMSDETNYNGYVDLMSKYSECMNEFKKLYEPFSTSKYKTIFFGDASDTEIAELVAKAVSSDELVELEDQVVSLQTRFDAMTNAQILGEEWKSLYRQFVTTENQISDFYGYDDYMTYCFPNVYYRDYGVSDAQTYINNLSDTVVNSAIASYQSLSAAQENISEERMDELDNIFDSYFLSAESQQLLDGFYSSLGSEIYSVYKQFISEGYYFIASSDNAYQGAYTSYFYTLASPYIYFSESYATVETFVHEFGHYLNFYLCDINDISSSYELKETQSQAAEWLLLNYVAENIITDEEEKSYVVQNKYFDSTYLILVSAYVASAEISFYQSDSIDAIDFDAVFADCFTELYGENLPECYNGFIKPESYFRLVAIGNPGYYLSYSVSLISSLEIYVAGFTDYDYAVAIYTGVVKSPSGYVDVLESYGLSSPFEKTTITEITTVLASI